jgi:FMN phosphatase YigB (HAD superfamily)
MVLDDLGIAPERVAMIGDDIENDIRGAQLLGMKGWLVRQAASAKRI